MNDFEKWFKTTESYKMLEEQNYFKMDLFFFVEARNQYRHSGVQVAYLTWQHQQAIIDTLQQENECLKVELDGCAKRSQLLMDAKNRWASKAQDCQQQVDSLKAQLNNMETCYIEKKKEAEDQQGRVSRALNFINNWWHPDLDQKLFVEAVANALRGDGD